MREFKSDFIYEFKAGDNIAFNFEILSELYTQINSIPQERSELLYKPVIIIIVSIIEAIFQDLVERIISHPEDFPLFSFENFLYFKTKELNNFEKLISGFRKNDLLKEDQKFYGYIDFLRKVRNRVHFKLNTRDLEPDDRNVFTKEILLKSERILETVLIKMNKLYSRSSNYHYVANFKIPWNEYQSLNVLNGKSAPPIKFF